MTTVQGSKNRRYEVRVTVHGTANVVYRLYYGDVFLAGTGENSTLEEAIESANIRADKLGLVVED